MGVKSCLIFCRCGASVIPEETLSQLEKGLKGFDIDVFELRDLCAFSVNEKDVLNAIGKEYQKSIIIGCYSRAVKNMLKQGGIELGDVEVLNFKELSVGQIFSTLGEEFKLLKGEACYQVRISALDVPAWFPVIDDSLCTYCGKCAQFCLFGVYKFKKKSLKVVNPLACKNNCPACGRTCPTSAIIFPRLAENTVLAGDVPTGKKNPAGKGSLFVMLNDRNQSRKNIFRQGLVKQAEEERRKALEELKSGIDKM
ncbi:hypothetical protein MNBD_BACTEROID01-654 [hydrothermal vent metagenome]|uniref:4Fe-4S ferredoxin-type domain-containing protein n=1 Tax=hydrothermal vent metagenome TaxID=652676 RepID=A0A3B0TTR4_9ZZZZ